MSTDIIDKPDPGDIRIEKRKMLFTSGGEPEYKEAVLNTLQSINANLETMNMNLANIFFKG